MFCNNCGAGRVQNSAVCHVCGFSESGGQVNPQPVYIQPGMVIPPVIDTGGFAWGFFGFIFSAFLFPLLLFFSWQKQTPLRARAMLIGYLLGVIVCIILCVIAVMVIIANYDRITEWAEAADAIITSNLYSL